MKRLAMCIVLILGAPFAGSVTAGEPTAILADGGFEEPLTANWGTGQYQTTRDWWVAGGAKAAAARDTTVAKSGQASLKIVNQSPLAPNVYGTIAQRITVKPGTPYRLVCWIKAENANPETLQVVLDPQWNIRLSMAAGTYDWRRFELTYTAKADESYLDVRLLSCTVGTAWIDDIQLTEILPVRAGFACPQLALGTARPLGSQTAQPAGGTLTFTDPGGTFDVVSMDVPAQAYAQPRDIAVTFHPLTQPRIDKHLLALSPLIEVQAGEQRAAEPLIVTVSVTLPDKHFAMGFYRDPSTGRLEGIPTLEVAADHVTLATTHFSSFLIGAIPDDALDLEIEQGIDTGFRPGVDDWGLTNYGSALAPGGHCAGQSLGAMWYYMEQHLGKNQPPLFKRYDDNIPLFPANPALHPPTPEFWEDDSQAYRFCSMVQHDLNTDWLVRLFRAARGYIPAVHRKAFAYSLLMTGSPQYLSVFKEGAGGHALIVYKIHGGTLYICDPNYPGQERTATYLDGKFEPFTAAATAAEIAAGNASQYDCLGYIARSALVNWEKIGERWTELERGAAGMGDFPDYALLDLQPDGTTVEMGGNHATERDVLTLQLQNKSRVTLRPALFVYDESTQAARPDNQADLPLQIGRNRIGVLIEAETSPGNWRYVDFRWLQIFRLAEDLTPPVLLPEISNGYTGKIPLTYHLLPDATDAYSGRCDHTLHIDMDAGENGSAAMDMRLGGQFSLEQKLASRNGGVFSVDTIFPAFAISLTSQMQAGGDSGAVQADFTQNGMTVKINQEAVPVPAETQTAMKALATSHGTIDKSAGRPIPAMAANGVPDDLSLLAAPLDAAEAWLHPALPAAIAEPNDTWPATCSYVKYGLPLRVTMQCKFAGYEIREGHVLCAKIECLNQSHAVDPEYRKTLTGLGMGDANADISLQAATVKISATYYLSVLDGSVLTVQTQDDIDATFRITITGADGGGAATLRMRLNGGVALDKAILDTRLYHDWDRTALFAWIPLQHGKIHGTVKAWRKDNGKLSREVPCVDGLMQGEARLYSRNGGIAETTPMDHGKIHGIRKRYNPAAAVIAVIDEIPYDQSRIQGTRKKYYDDGRPRAEIAYVNNQRHGLYREYAADGTPLLEARYENGRVVSWTLPE